MLTPIKSQGPCGACWSFSATAAMESHHAIKTGVLYSLSEEQILDCSHNRDHSCGGGMPAYAFQYLAAEGGQELESAYPYTSGNNPSGHGKAATCNFAKSKAAPNVTTAGSFNLTSGDLAQLQAMVANVG